MLVTKFAKLLTNKGFDLAQAGFWLCEAAGVNAVYRALCAHALQSMLKDPKANVYDAAVIEAMDMPASVSSELIENQRQMALIFVEMLTEPSCRAENKAALEEAVKQYLLKIFDAKGSGSEGVVSEAPAPVPSN